MLLTSSLTHRAGRLDFGDLQAEARYHPLGQYAATKLASIVLARDLQRRFDQCAALRRSPPCLTCCALTRGLTIPRTGPCWFAAAA